MNTRAEEKVKNRPSLSILAMLSFIASFAVARTFTTLNPHFTWTIGNYHVHHLWYGIAMLGIGGWLGISYESIRIERLAAILFGAGGGIVGDEAGLLLTMKDYWTGITYSLIIIFLTFVLILFFLFRYSRTVVAEFTGLARSREGIYFGVFLAVISVTVMLETDNVIALTVSGALTMVSCLVIIGYFIQHFRKKPPA
jgi:hypothetical protein